MAVPDLWVHTAAVPTYYLPHDGALSWGMDRISAGYAWGQSVIGNSNTRICIIGRSCRGAVLLLGSGLPCLLADLGLPLDPPLSPIVPSARTPTC